MGARNGKPYRYYSEFKDWCFSILGDKCNVCNSEKDLQIDHINRNEKIFNITNLWTRKTLDEMRLELSKCQVLCKKCHLEKTIPELRESGLKQGRTHGTTYVWMKLKCVCDKCLKAKRLWYDARNSRRRVSDNTRAYNQPADHGSYLKYKRGCRCDECRKANSDKAANDRKNKKYLFLTDKFCVRCGISDIEKLCVFGAGSGIFSKSIERIKTFFSSPSVFVGCRECFPNQYY